jgi:hypothetical protein
MINIDEFLLQNNIVYIDKINPSFKDVIPYIDDNLSSVVYNMEYYLNTFENEKTIKFGIADIIQLNPNCSDDFILYIDNFPVVNTTTVPTFILLFNKEIKFKLKDNRSIKKLNLIGFTLNNSHINRLRRSIITNNDGLTFKEWCV